jgi:hypothetical protein
MQTKSVISKKPGMTVTTDVKAGFEDMSDEQFQILKKMLEDIYSIGKIVMPPSILGNLPKP